MASRHLSAVLACVTAASFYASAGHAGPREDEAFQLRLFGRTLAKTPIHACFDRVYDAGHLATHPLQKVRTMKLLVTAKSGGADAGPSYDLSMGVTFRKSGAHFETGGSCGSIHDQTSPGEDGKVAHCGVDCDGGRIDVSLRDRTSLLVAIPDGARVSNGKSDESTAGTDRARFGTDDKTFRLDKVALTNCLKLAGEAADKRAMRHGE